jgi:hypothetical protein
MSLHASTLHDVTCNYMIITCIVMQLHARNDHVIEFYYM